MPASWARAVQRRRERTTWLGTSHYVLFDVRVVERSCRQARRADHFICTSSGTHSEYVRFATVFQKICVCSLCIKANITPRSSRSATHRAPSARSPRTREQGCSKREESACDP